MHCNTGAKKPLEIWNYISVCLSFFNKGELLSTLLKYIEGFLTETSSSFTFSWLLLEIILLKIPFKQYV